MNTDDLLDSREAARYLGLTYGHIKDLRSDGKGPVYLKNAAGRVRYARSDLDRYIRFDRAGGGAR